MRIASLPEADRALIQRARDLVPVLIDRVRMADELRRVPEVTIADFKTAGFFRMVQPRRFGGLEVDPGTFFEVQMTLASACPSSAWVMAVVGVHSWQLALFPERAQLDVWGNDHEALISSSYAPTGRIERADGGYRVSGRWSYSSGCDHCTWVFLGGFVPPPEPGLPAEMRTFLLPRSAYRIEDNWHVMGLKGTGSKDIVVDGAFVPEHRTHRLIDGFRRKSPGHEVNAAPLFRIPFGQIFVRAVTTSSLGITQGALDAFLGIARDRIAASDGTKASQDPMVQHACAEAEAVIDEGRLVLFRNMEELMEQARAGEDMPVDRRVKFRYDASRIVQRCVDAVDGLFAAAGGRALFQDHPVQRFFLDIHSARAHFASNPDKPGRNLGGVHLGQKNTDLFL